MVDTPEFTPIRWAGEHLELLDQTRLPAEEVWLECREPEDVAAAIRRLSVRGAPAIGVAAAFGLVLGVDGAAGEVDLSPHMTRLRRIGSAFRLTFSCG